MEVSGYTTLAAETRHEIDRVKGSRFLATARPVATATEAAALVARLRREFHDARHTCWAYRLGPAGDRFRAGDDGEPPGSAGRPILRQIDGRGLTCVAVAVTRYFGGTKLGTGGLARAYGGAAAAVLDRAEKHRVVVTRRIVVDHPYDCAAAVQALVARTGIVPASADYGARVRLAFDVPVDRAAAFVRDLRSSTRGSARIE